ncbi:MAG: squalene/phytoene synthase family protein, partial [Acidobacteria bacterium]|nr:squalene/phytoene synthase family protein [Acidobacteriota bacterium]
MATSLQSSYQHCHRLARARARNFYYGFWLLPRPRRDAFCAVYSFMRYCDDVADGQFATAEKVARLREWHDVLDRALAGDYNDNRILPAFHDAVQRYQIPAEYFHELIAGTEMDLTVRSYRTFEELYQYCYRVASVVGLCSLHMFGFLDPKAKLLAERCGIAFQLTNILRDVPEDAAAGRIYVPLEDLEKFGYTPEQLVAGVRNQAYRQLMRNEIARARAYYEEAAPLIEMVEPESRPALWTLVSIYRRVLRVIEQGVEQEVEQGVAHAARQGREAGGTESAANPDYQPASISDMEKMVLVFRAAMMRLQL